MHMQVYLLYVSGFVIRSLGFVSPSPTFPTPTAKVTKRDFLPRIMRRDPDNSLLETRSRK